MITKNTYLGTLHSDNVIHENIVPLLNYFKKSSYKTTVKIMSNAKAKNLYNIRDFDEDQLIRNKHAYAHLRVQECKDNGGTFRNWEFPKYYYITTSKWYFEDKLYFSFRKDLVRAWTDNNKDAYVILMTDSDFAIVPISDIVLAYSDTINHISKVHSTYIDKNNALFLYNVEDNINIQWINKDFSPRNDEHYYEKVHLGVCRYSKHIAGTNVFLAMYDSVTGERTKLFREARSIKEAYSLITEEYKLTLNDIGSYKTFVRRVKARNVIKASGNKKSYYFMVSESEPDNKLFVTKTNNHIDIFGEEVWDTELKSFDELYNDTEKAHAKKENISVEELENKANEEAEKMFEEVDISPVISEEESNKLEEELPTTYILATEIETTKVDGLPDYYDTPTRINFSRLPIRKSPVKKDFDDSNYWKKRLEEKEAVALF